MGQPKNVGPLRRFRWGLAFSLPLGFARRLVAAPLVCVASHPTAQTTQTDRLRHSTARIAAER